MSDFPEGVAAPDGAQKLVDVCKGTWAVIQDEPSEVTRHDKAVDSFEAAMDETCAAQRCGRASRGPLNPVLFTREKGGKQRAASRGARADIP